MPPPRGYRSGPPASLATPTPRAHAPIRSAIRLTPPWCRSCRLTLIRACSTFRPRRLRDATNEVNGRALKDDSATPSKELAIGSPELDGRFVCGKFPDYGGGSPDGAAADRRERGQGGRQEGQRQNRVLQRFAAAPERDPGSEELHRFPDRRDLLSPAGGRCSPQAFRDVFPHSATAEPLRVLSG